MRLLLLRPGVAPAVVFAVLLGSQVATAQPNADAFRPLKVLDPLPPITEFPIKRVNEVGDALNPAELVIGVTVGKESRAYPINMLTGPRREILNDMIGGKSIATTW